MTQDTPKDRLQRHLGLLRGCAGWTAEIFANKLEVSRATVSTLERDGHELTMMQYLAIRKLYEDEIARSADDTNMLASVLKVVIDNPDDYTEEEIKEVLDKARLMAPTIIRVPSERKSMNNAWKALLTASGVIATAALVAVVFGKSKDE